MSKTDYEIITTQEIVDKSKNFYENNLKEQIEIKNQNIKLKDKKIKILEKTIEDFQKNIDIFDIKISEMKRKLESVKLTFFNTNNLF